MVRGATAVIDAAARFVRLAEAKAFDGLRDPHEIDGGRMFVEVGIEDVEIILHLEGLRSVALGTRTADGGESEQTYPKAHVLIQLLQFLLGRAASSHYAEMNGDFACVRLCKHGCVQRRESGAGHHQLIGPIEGVRRYEISPAITDYAVDDLLTRL